MARKRMIDPEFWLDEELAKLSPHARLLYIGSWNICDDNYATFPNKLGWLKIQIFPYENVDIQSLLNELSASGHLTLFNTKNGDHWHIKNFFKYQKVDHPSAPKYEPYPRAVTEQSASPRSQLSNKVISLNNDLVKKETIDKIREQLKGKIKGI